MHREWVGSRERHLELFKNLHTTDVPELDRDLDNSSRVLTCTLILLILSCIGKHRHPTQIQEMKKYFF
jgi:hypothetical protein